MPPRLSTFRVQERVVYIAGRIYAINITDSVEILSQVLTLLEAESEYRLSEYASRPSCVRELERWHPVHERNVAAAGAKQQRCRAGHTKR